jgi:hypothetical protein
MATSSSYLLCIENRGYSVSLDLRKVYRQVPDPTAEVRGLVRVEDESGEDYLYPVGFFVPLEVPEEATRLFSPKSA